MEEAESTTKEAELTTKEAELTTEEIESTTEETELTTEETSAPEISQYWEISNGHTSLYALVLEKEPYMVQYFESANATAHQLNEVKFEVLVEDFVRRVK